LCSTFLLIIRPIFLEFPDREVLDRNYSQWYGQAFPIESEALMQVLCDEEAIDNAL